MKIQAIKMVADPTRYNRKVVKPQPKPEDIKPFGSTIVENLNHPIPVYWLI